MTTTETLIILRPVDWYAVHFSCWLIDQTKNWSNGLEEEKKDKNYFQRKWKFRYARKFLLFSVAIVNLRVKTAYLLWHIYLTIFSVHILPFSQVKKKNLQPKILQIQAKYLGFSISFISFRSNSFLFSFCFLLNFECKNVWHPSNKWTRRRSHLQSFEKAISIKVISNMMKRKKIDFNDKKKNKK